MSDGLSRNALFDRVAAELGRAFDGVIKVGGNYVPLLRDKDQVFVSGQIPRVGDAVVVTGRLGDDLDLEQGRLAARICVMRALALLRRELGDLARVRQVLRVGVYVQSAAGFTQQSEVADAASELLHRVLSGAGTHTRTSVGVIALPKNAAVEIDLVAAVD